MIVRDAYRFLVPLAFLALLLFILGFLIPGLLLTALFVFVAFFFRNPPRSIPDDPRLIVSPADGKVVRVEKVGNVTRMSIFLSLFNVHVNRSPIAGRIEAVEYKPGRFLVAFNDKASSVQTFNFGIILYENVDYNKWVRGCSLYVQPKKQIPILAFHHRCSLLHGWNDSASSVKLLK